MRTEQTKLSIDLSKFELISDVNYLADSYVQQLCCEIQEFRFKATQLRAIIKLGSEFESFFYIYNTKTYLRLVEVPGLQKYFVKIKPIFITDNAIT